ncbi:MAG: ankyrin repeat domain-containing protein [Bacteriovoracaceae bacterium]
MNPKNFTISYAWDDSIKTTQLGFDAYHGLVQKIKLAVDAKIDWSQEGVEALHGAIFGRQQECFEILLNNGSPTNSYTHYLLCQIMPKLYEKYFLEAKYSATLDKTTATKNLINSCQYGSTILCQHFLNAGADPNSTSDGILPLISATSKLRLDLIEVLLSHGAQINLTGKSKHSPLRHMVSSGSHLDKELRKQIYEYMISRGAIPTPSFNQEEEKAAKQGDIVPLQNLNSI